MGSHTGLSVAVLLASGVAAALFALPATADTQRDLRQRAEFVKQHPCPSTGKVRRACPGYVVDHIKPLCAGGPDRPSNMQWQTRMDAKIKDREERRLCRGRSG
jgi:hypothetical protein